MKLKYLSKIYITNIYLANVKIYLADKYGKIYLSKMDFFYRHQRKQFLCLHTLMRIFNVPFQLMHGSLKCIAGP